MNARNFLNSTIAFCDASIPQCHHLGGELDSTLLVQVLILRERAAKLLFALTGPANTRNLVPARFAPSSHFAPHAKLAQNSVVVFGD